jgi:signal transduction histidine kinase
MENLLDGVEEPNPALLRGMLQQADRLTRLVDQLLDLSRMESGDLALSLGPVQLSPLVDRVMSEVAVARPERAKTLTVNNDVPTDLPLVEADQERIHQVLFNLLDNAFRFTPDGGSVRVRAVLANGSCEVSVEDTGPGIPEVHLPLVFERFYRVDPSRSRDDGGTGIGLAIARSIVDAHGGKIWAESDEGKGSTFRFVLPLAGRAAPPGEREVLAVARRSDVPAADRVKEGV